MVKKPSPGTRPPEDIHADLLTLINRRQYVADKLQHFESMNDFLRGYEPQIQKLTDQQDLVQDQLNVVREEAEFQLNGTSESV